MRHHGVAEGETDDGFPVWTYTEAALLLLVRPAVWDRRFASLHPPRGSVRDGRSSRPWLVPNRILNAHFKVGNLEFCPQHSLIQISFSELVT